MSLTTISTGSLRRWLRRVVRARSDDAAGAAVPAGSQAYRLPLRVGAYDQPLAFVIWWFDRAGRREGKHPGERFLLLALVVLVMGLAHPLTEQPTVRPRADRLYFAIFCPLFWARAYITTRRQLMRVVLILLVCNGLNSMVGVLQVYDPGRWMPRELSSMYQGNSDFLAAASYVGPNGRMIIRPPGLFDTPGAVCGAGTIAALFGLILALEPLAIWRRGIVRSRWRWLASRRSTSVTSACRSSSPSALMAVYVAILSTQKQMKRVTAFDARRRPRRRRSVIATVLGGQSIMERFSTLVAEDPRELSTESRGQSVEYAFNNLIAEYPLGAGLARWGMMAFYFGGPRPYDAPAVFAEVQPNAWLLDGGIFLLLFYTLALGVTVAYDLKRVRTLANREDRLWAAAVIAANFGTLALLFSFVPFGTAVGMQFWFS